MSAQLSNPNRTLSNWLFLCAALVFAMATIGAITRLTESGLSITEWKPVTGALPPLNDAAWEHEFNLYRASPEFAAKHSWMNLGDFKHIFFWEWTHRLLGRMIGLVYALPLLWFAARRQIPPGWGLRLIGILALGGLQGLIGWLMVKSGLVDRPSVSHFRLAIHLDTALVLFAALLWAGLSMRRPALYAVKDKGGWRFGWIVLCLLATTITWGAFTAGLHAGKIYNEFPLMGNSFVPGDFGNPFTSLAGVQFTHRWLAVTTACLVMFYAWMTRRSNRLAPFLAAMVMLQVGLGISTLLSSVNIDLAAMHQAGAITLLGLLIASQHVLSHHQDSKDLEA